MTIHAMIDLETLGTSQDTVVLSLGAVKFSPFNSEDPTDALYIKPDVDEQTSVLNRTVDDDTLRWWNEQPSEISDEALSEDDRVSCVEFLAQLNRWCVGVDILWCQGPLFDYAILEDFYRNMQQPCAWNFWQIRDSRTLFALMPKDPRKAIQQQLHNALADAYFQAQCVQSTYKHLNIERPEYD
tara:strand:+ start:12 stop:563 length:552 start_codon:yes stop_codon:yes gene_type:complete